MSTEASAVPPSGWPVAPVWSLVESREEYGGDGPLLSLSAEFGVRERMAGEGRAASEDTSSYRVVRPGDVVINRLSARDGAYAVSRMDGLVSPAYWVLRPRTASVDSRWLDYVLRAAPYVAELQRISKFMPPAQFDLPWAQFRRLPIPVPSHQHQWAIAALLDTETARIDALIAKKAELMRVMEERRAALFESIIRDYGVDLYDCVTQQRMTNPLPHGWAVLTLGRIVRQLTNGYVGPTRDILVDDGIRYLQSLHIKGGRIEFDRHPFYVKEKWHAERPRIALRPWDVLIVQTGDIGQVAVVPADFGPATCHALLIARSEPELVTSDFLAVYLQSTVGRNELLRLATGALHPHLEFGIRATPVVVPPLEQQRSIVETVHDARGRIDGVQSCLHRQIALLHKRRQALITAVVTGQLDIPGLAA